MMKDIHNSSYIAKLRTGVTLSGVLFRLLAAYLGALLAFYMNSSLSLTDFAYFHEVSLPLLLLLTLACFLLLQLIPGQLPILLLILAEALVYSIFAIDDQKNLFFVLGCTAVIGVFIFYTDITDRCPRLPKPVFMAVAILLFLTVALCTGLDMVARYQGNHGSCFDLGIFSQMFYHMKESLQPLTTCERDGLLSHFAVHVSPAYYLLFPFFAVCPTVPNLLMLHSFFCFSGLLPLLLISRKHGFSRPAGLLLSICYLLSPAFSGGFDYFIHENSLLPPLILWLLLALETLQEQFRIRNLLFFLLAALLLLGVKEDAPVYTCSIALYFMFRNLQDAGKERAAAKLRRLLGTPGLWLFLLSLVYFVLAVTMLSKYGDGTLAGSRYSNYFYDGSSSLVTMFVGLVKNPVYVISQCMNGQKLEFLAFLLVPLGFLPLLNRRFCNLFLLIPLLFINLMPEYYYQHDIHYQYVFGTGTLLIYLAVLNYEDLQSGCGRRLLLTAAIGSLLMYSFLFSNHLRFTDRFRAEADYRQVCEEAFALIPEDASVVASTFLLPALSQRAEIYELETTQKTGGYYVVDLRGNTNNISYDNDPDYEPVYYHEDVIAIYKYLPAAAD